MSKITFLGLGAMGSRMARRLLDAGHELTLWNRSPSATEDLCAAGAARAATPRAAAEGAEFVLSMLRDDAAVADVWLDPATGALGGMPAQALAVECSTLSIQGIQALGEAATAKGIRLLEAPLAGSRPQAEAGKLIFLAGGEQADLARAMPLLTAMGAAVHHTGTLGSGAVMKLMVNAMFGAQLGLLGELLAFARRSGSDAELLLDILSQTPVCSPAAALAGRAMLAGQWAPAFPIDLVAKDFGLLARSAEGTGAALPLSAETGRIFAQALAEGFGQDNITGIIQRYQDNKAA